jgi:predicted RNA-binding protein with PIN domain
MRFLVDGYNVTKQDPATARLALAEQRESLVARLAVRGADLLGAGEIVVVFDGVAGGGSDARRGQVRVRYSRDEPADELITRLAGAGTTVVTSDAGLASRTKAAGASVLGAESCFEARRPKRRKGRYPAGSAGLPKGANEITRELKELWLDGEE